MPASIDRLKQRFGSFIILLVTATTAHADLEGFGGWTVFTASGALGEAGTPWRLHFDAQYRKPEFDLSADQILLTVDRLRTESGLVRVIGLRLLSDGP